MTEISTPSPAPRAGLLRRTWDFVRRPAATIALGTLLVVGFGAGILFWGGFHWALEMTNTEKFCIGCHEMEENVFAEYKQTIHYQNHSGVRATCPDCHVPREWQHKIVRKIQASKELYGHFITGSIWTKEKFEANRIHLAQSEWRRMKAADSRECRNCHAFEYMDFTKQETRAGRRHQEAVDTGKTCIDCHQGIAHRLPQGGRDAYEEAVKDLQQGAAVQGLERYAAGLGR
ncbi:NapC/NirT family cytochrome c [Prosthecomicrobium sp. N25]|uniref:NapC/NirT family cytochrome c n=1 Tax=Prosthecomicrobium sp. N25 TaxID=3129254 RepID=UPI003076EC51